MVAGALLGPAPLLLAWLPVRCAGSAPTPARPNAAINSPQTSPTHIAEPRRRAINLARMRLAEAGAITRRPRGFGRGRVASSHVVAVPALVARCRAAAWPSGPRRPLPRRPALLQSESRPVPLCRRGGRRLFRFCRRPGLCFRATARLHRTVLAGREIALRQRAMARHGHLRSGRQLCRHVRSAPRLQTRSQYVRPADRARRLGLRRQSRSQVDPRRGSSRLLLALPRLSRGSQHRHLAQPIRHRSRWCAEDPLLDDLTLARRRRPALRCRRLHTADAARPRDLQDAAIDEREPCDQARPQDRRMVGCAGHLLGAHQGRRYRAFEAMGLEPPLACPAHGRLAPLRRRDDQPHRLRQACQGPLDRRAAGARLRRQQADHSDAGKREAERGASRPVALHRRCPRAQMRKRASPRRGRAEGGLVRADADRQRSSRPAGQGQAARGARRAGTGEVQGGPSQPRAPRQPAAASRAPRCARGDEERIRLWLARVRPRCDADPRCAREPPVSGDCESPACRAPGGVSDADRSRLHARSLDPQRHRGQDRPQHRHRGRQRQGRDRPVFRRAGRRRLFWLIRGQG